VFGVVTLIVAAKPPAQAEMVPFRLAKMKRAEVVVSPGDSWKDVRAPQHAETPHPVGLLRARRQRPRGSGAAKEQGDELAPSYT
jgi:hypothetical protein